jgi:hypothetical protein
MKYWFISLLICISTSVYADSTKAIQARLEWVTTEFEQGRMTEAESLREYALLSDRIEQLDAPAIIKSVEPVTTVSQFTGNVLMRQAAVPSVTAPIYESSGSVARWSIRSIFTYTFCVGVVIAFGIIVIVFGQGDATAQRSQHRQNTATTAGMDRVDRGPSLAASMGGTAAHAAPQQRVPQSTTPAPQNSQPARRSRWNIGHHSGEISI